MTGEQLLQLSSSELLTDRGKKILGEPFDIESIKLRISYLATRYKIDLEEVKKITTEELNEVQKQQQKTDKTLTAREKIAAKKKKLTSSEDTILNAKLEIKTLQNKLDSVEPTLEKFTITGRVFNNTDGNVLSGVKVELGLDTTPTIQKQADSVGNIDLLNQDIIPEIDFNNLVLTPIGPNSTRTDKNGNFTLDVEIPIIPKNQKSILVIGLLYTKSSFIPSSSPLLNGDQTVKTNLSAASLQDITKASKQISKEYNLKIDQAKEGLNRIALGPAEWILSQRKGSIHKIVDTIKTKLIPLAIGMLIQFGISKLTQSNLKTCPTSGNLQDVIRQRNRVIRQLNQIYQTITINVVLSAAFLAISKVLGGVRLSLDNLPLLQAIGGPGPIGLVFSLPYSFTAKLQDINDKLEKLERQNLALNKSQLTSLVFLIAGTVTVVALLQGIDKMIQECIQESVDNNDNNNQFNIELIAINQDLLDISEEQKEDGNPVLSNVNGFIFSVETDNTNLVGTLKRRFAVAKDSRGITLLRGESSFSSSDQILIDELVFYIQQNDLKAN